MYGTARHVRFSKGDCRMLTEANQPDLPGKQAINSKTADQARTGSGVVWSLVGIVLRIKEKKSCHVGL